MVVEVCSLSYDCAVSVLQSPFMIVALGMTWFIPLLIYLITGCIARGRDSSGRVMSKPMIMFPNFYYGLLIFGLIQLIFFLLLLFPIWLRLLGKG